MCLRPCCDGNRAEGWLSEVQEVPRLVDGGEEPAAAAAPEEVLEDEFDLADILGEEVGVKAPSKDELIKQADEVRCKTTVVRCKSLATASRLRRQCGQTQ